MRATILLFAQAREMAGVSSLTVELPSAPTILDLKSALVRACPELGHLIKYLKIAVNSEYADDDHELIPTGAELAAIPPVSGGSPLGVLIEP